ncbi:MULTISPECIES: HNH endonuclease signature motif containing protein [Enterobacter]|uniref:HNH endonuclease signature motif containing protein n=1 Tax=Enterobacter TaxID=547 RepID=UPI00111C62FA|nr:MULTISPECIES: HNH endonuclease signature motif containing protein [Enterobacter]
MKVNFRNHNPIRKFTKKYATYTAYKKYLAEDFNYRCGYTDCPDFWFGGQDNFHIDHFIPWKNHPEQPALKTDYSNLVYCCSYVNILKSNDESNYLDPCSVDYNQHFYRDVTGHIKPISGSLAASYMYSKLKMYMRRYQIIWMLDNLFEKLQSLSCAIEETKDESLKNDLKNAMCELVPIVVKYKCYLSESQKK